MAHPGIYLVSLEVQKEGQRLKKRKTLASKTRREASGSTLLKSACRHHPLPWCLAPQPRLGRAERGAARCEAAGAGLSAAACPGTARERTANRVRAFHVAFFHRSDIIICRALGPSLPLSLSLRGGLTRPRFKRPEMFCMKRSQ